MGSSFTLTLANVFMWKWQKEFVRQQNMTGAFYGQYIEDVFMTWNKSEKKLKDLLDQKNTWHPNIKLDYTIIKSLPFLDVLLQNNNGILFTSVYHKPAAKPYVVPFIFDHPRHVLVNVMHNTLAHGVRYLSTFKTFNHERHYIKLMLTSNGQPIYRQSQAALSVATADIDNDQTDEEKIKPTEPDNQQEKKEKDYENKLFIHYNTNTNTTNTIWY